MSVEAPPNQQPIVTDKSGFIAMPWAIFFNSIYTGDAGQAWVPIIANMTITGASPTVNGRVYQLNKFVAFFVITITPPTGSSISGTAGTVAVTNFPLTMSDNGACFIVSGNLGGSPGMCDVSTNKIYPGSFSNVTVPVSIIGIVEAS